MAPNWLQLDQILRLFLQCRLGMVSDYSCLKIEGTDKPVIEHITLPGLHRRGIRLGYTPDVLTDAGQFSLSPRTLLLRTRR